MKRLLELLGLVGTITVDDQGVFHAADVEALDDAALAGLAADLSAEITIVLDSEPDDDQLEPLQRAGQALDVIARVRGEREAAAASRQTLIDGLRTRAAQASSQAGEPAGGGDGAGEGAGAGTGDPGAGSGGSGGDAGGGDGGTGEAGAGDGSGEGGEGTETPSAEELARAVAAEFARLAAVAASGAPVSPRISGVNARGPGRPKSMAPRIPDDQLSRLPVVAAANLSGIPAGEPLDDPIKLAKAFMAAYEQSKGYAGVRAQVAVCRIGGSPRELYGEDRYLSEFDEGSNEVKIMRVLEPESMAASGGFCAPVNVNYDMPTIGSDARPVRDTALTRFGAERGGAKTFPPPTIADVGGAIGIWTAANDANPSNPAVKPCLTMTCPDPTTSLVEAITRCLQVGNFRARYFPEQVAAWLNNVAVQHARTAEIELINKIASGSTHVSTTQLFSASVDLLSDLDRAIARYESFHRLDDNHPPLRFMAPLWLTDMIRADIVRQPRTGLTIDEHYAVADAEIEALIKRRNLNVTWMLDGETGQIFGPQGDGPMQAWPAQVLTYLFAEGEWLFLDGGMIDLGIVRDSTLNAKNDYQIFAETMEGAHFHGFESQRIAMPLCPDGVMQAAATINVCSTGS